jgi:hypothetical protein
MNWRVALVLAALCETVSLGGNGMFKERVVVCEPEFVMVGHAHQTYLVEGTNRFQAIWKTSDFFFGKVRFERGKTYSFTLLEFPNGAPPGPRIVRVQGESNILYDATECPVHGISMQPVVASRKPGFRAPGEPFITLELEKRLFPHHRNNYWEGCLIIPGPAPVRVLYVCQECQADYARWREKALEDERKNSRIPNVETNRDVPKLEKGS